MKIASWNINSVRARTARFLSYLTTAQPDVLCVQELKCQEHEFPLEEVRAAGYHAILHGQKTYNGVAILSRSEPQQPLLGLSDGVEDPQSRVVAATVDGVRVVCVYAPNGQTVGSEAYAYKLRWFERLRAYLDQRHREDQPLVVAGDFNVAPANADVHDPAAWEGHVLFSQPERSALAEVMGFGLTDSFRALHPDEQKFSWWDYRQLAFPKNRGLRIDLVLATAKVMERAVGAGIDRDQRKGQQPSDHAPIWLELR